MGMNLNIQQITWANPKPADREDFQAPAQLMQVISKLESKPAGLEKTLYEWHQALQNRGVAVWSSRTPNLGKVMN